MTTRKAKATVIVQSLRSGLRQSGWPLRGRLDARLKAPLYLRSNGKDTRRSGDRCGAGLDGGLTFRSDANGKGKDNSRSPSGMTTRKATAKAGARGNGKGEMRFFAALRMTRIFGLRGREQQRQLHRR
jgi:hypothetical protein